MTNPYENALIEIQGDIWKTADEAGWHEKERELPEIVALCHSELSEALEAWRDGMEVTDVLYEYTDHDGSVTGTPGSKYRTHLSTQRDPVSGEVVLGKPEGVASELADTIIRILDYSGHAEIPTIQIMFQKMMFNRTRAYRHENKRC